MVSYFNVGRLVRLITIVDRIPVGRQMVDEFGVRGLWYIYGCAGVVNFGIRGCPCA